MYQIKMTSLFQRRLNTLQRYFQLSDDLTREAISELKFTIEQLKETGSVPSEYDDLELTDSPWRGWREYHLLDDLLVVYIKIEKNQVIRLTTLTTHHELRKGNISTR